MKKLPPSEPAGVRVAVAPLSSALLQLVRAHATFATRRLGELGLVPPQELVLLYLDEHGPSAQRELVRYLGRDRSTVTATVQTMERAGLIDRSRVPDDKRAFVVALTDRGSALCPAVQAVWRELEDATFGRLGAADRRRLADALESARRHVSDALDEPGAAASPYSV